MMKLLSDVVNFIILVFLIISVVWSIATLEDCKERFGYSPAFCISHFFNYETVSP